MALHQLESDRVGGAFLAFGSGGHGTRIVAVMGVREGAMGRLIALWIFGIAASAIFGGLIGDYLDGDNLYGKGGFWGFVGGACAFVCARLWLAKPKKQISN